MAKVKKNNDKVIVQLSSLELLKQTVEMTETKVRFDTKEPREMRVEERLTSVTVHDMISSAVWAKIMEIKAGSKRFPTGFKSVKITIDGITIEYTV